MANQIIYKNQTLKIGDMISIHYLIKEGEKSRIQIFKGYLIKIKGQTPTTKTITVRKLSKAGIGVERIFPLSSPAISDIKVIKKSNYTKASAFFIRKKTESEINKRLYGKKAKQDRKIRRSIS